MIILLEILVGFMNRELFKWDGLSSNALLVCRETPDIEKKNKKKKQQNTYISSSTYTYTVITDPKTK